MLISTIGPNETIRWFEEQDLQHEILCCMITADPRHRAILGELAQSYLDSDAALGSRVGFVLFGGVHPKAFVRLQDRDGGLRIYIPGEFLASNHRAESRLSVIALRDWAERSRVWNGSDSLANTFADDAVRDQIGWAATMLADQTAGVADDWMKVVGVQRGQLPVLCILVKGREAAIIPLGQEVDASSVRRLFGQLADIAQREIRAAQLPPCDAVARLGRAQALMAKIEASQAGMEEKLEEICNRFGASAEERSNSVEFLVRKNYSAEAVERLFESFSFHEAEPFQSSPVTRRFLSHCKILRKSINQLQADMPVYDDLRSLSEEKRLIEARRDETAQLVAQLQAKGVAARVVEKDTTGGRFDRWSTRANQLGNLVEKGTKLLDWLDKSPLFVPFK